MSDMLKGKQGRFRQNLLGKRVDYSGRSVIVVGPELRLHQCGLPKKMALELFKPFIMSRLVERSQVQNIKAAKKLVDSMIPEVWDVLEEVIAEHPVLLNRAPTLHRLGIQAFEPVLVEGKAIQIHPLVCTAFNADFDGDQMAVHVPLSDEAQMEAREIISANKNILKPGSSEPVVSEGLMDIALGAFWMTRMVEGAKGEGKAFSSPNDAINAYDYGVVDLRAKVKVLSTDTPKYAMYEGGIFETTVGRLIFNAVLPSDHDFVNEQLGQRELFAIIIDLIDEQGTEIVPKMVDKIKKNGFKFATISGTTWGIDEVVVPEEKAALVAEGRAQEFEVLEHYNQGLLSRAERKAQITAI